MGGLARGVGEVLGMGLGGGVLERGGGAGWGRLSLSHCFKRLPRRFSNAVFVVLPCKFVFLPPNPDPPILVFSWSKKQPNKNQDFFSSQTHKILGKGSKNAEKTMEFGKQKSKPKGPCCTKKCYDGVIHYRRSNSLFLEIFSEFPQETRCFRDPALVFCYRRSVCYHRSELL